MLVGSDVVDLRDPESLPEAIHPRFDARVFTAQERRGSGWSAASHVFRWSLWAAKESAYKVAKKLDPAVRFLPRDFVVQRIAEGRAVVVHETGPFDVRLDRTDERIHAIATPAAAKASPPIGPLRAGIERLAAPGADPSRSVRTLVCAELGAWMDVPPEQLQIGADRGIPIALWQNQRLPVDLSLSHHGRFVAWAWGEF